MLLGLATFSGFGLAGIAAVFAAYQAYRSQLPDAATLAQMEPSQDTRVYARDGTLVAILTDGGYRHQHVALREVSPWAKLATVDVEDRHFYQEGSWDLPRILKAGFDNVRHQSATQGASTITEQLAKISFLCTGSCDRSVDRKIKQFILGVEIENNFSKDQILEMYLNRVDYGNHSFGIESAAETYFHTTAHDLDLAQAAMLAGLPNAPATLDPLLHGAHETVNPRAKQRQRVVLEAMVRTGDITQAQADAAYAEPLTFHPYWDSQPQLAPDFVDYLRRWLDDHYGSQYLNPGGWDITTSLDLGKQALAERTVHDGVAKIYDAYNARDGALVAMDPRTGEVLALVGAWDDGNPGVGQLNMALRRLQPGSTIKLFTYTAAIATRAFTVRSPIVDAPVTFNLGYGQTYSPQNYDRRFHGVCALEVCLGNSLNVPAVKVEAKVGIPLITDLEIAAGLRSLADPDNRPGPLNYAATLGALHHGITPLELADGVSTIASLGVHHDPAPVLRIVDRSTHRTLYAHDPGAEGQRVVPANVAYIITQVTSNDRNRAMEFGYRSDLTLPDRRVSAKTGTTEFFESNWTVGWTPDLVSVVWVGNPSPSCLRPEDRAALTARLARGDRLSFYGSDQNLDDPYTPSELAHYHLQPINDHCGHLEGSTGITGAAPIWNAFMRAALAGTPKTWYTRPVDVIATDGDDGDFYLPGTASAGDGGQASSSCGTAPCAAAARPTPSFQPAVGPATTPGPPPSPHHRRQPPASDTPPASP